MSNAFFVPAKAMVIVAHPDDIEFGCACTVACWVEAGAEVCYVLVTSGGDVGIADLSITRARYRRFARRSNCGPPKSWVSRRSSSCASLMAWS